MCRAWNKVIIPAGPAGGGGGEYQLLVKCTIHTAIKSQSSIEAAIHIIIILEFLIKSDKVLILQICKN